MRGVVSVTLLAAVAAVVTFLCDHFVSTNSTLEPERSEELAAAVVFAGVALFRKVSWRARGAAATPVPTSVVRLKWESLGDEERAGRGGEEETVSTEYLIREQMFEQNKMKVMIKVAIWSQNESQKKEVQESQKEN
jgi:hypothetical protein